MSRNSTTVLLVEDNPSDAQLLKQAFAEAGEGRIDVTHVEHLDVAERCLAEGGFDAVLLDLSLPDADGTQAVIRARAAAPDIPLVVLTEHKDEAAAISALQRGAQDYLIKGEFDGPLLMRVFRYALERHQATAELERTNQRLQDEITERQRAEEAVRERARCLRSQNDMLVALAQSESLQSRDLDAFVREMTEAATRTLEVPRVSVWLYRGESRLRCIDSYDSTALYEGPCAQHSSGAELDAGSCPEFLEALKEQRTIAVTDAEEDPRTSEIWRQYLMPQGGTSALVAPIRPGGRLAGFICHEYSGRRRSWRLEEEQFAGSLGDLIATVIEASERQRAEKALRNVEDRLRTVVGNAPVVLFALDANGTFTLAEGKAIRAFQFEQNELIGCSVFDAFPEVPEMVEGARRALGGDESGTSVNVGGATFEVCYVPIFEEDGGVNGVIGVATDVSDLAHADERRRQLEARVRTAEKLGSLDLLASGIAREFRSLLAQVLRSTQVALDHLPDGSWARRHVQHIQMAAIRTSGLARQLLTCTGETKAASQSVYLSGLVKEMARTLQVWVPKTTVLEFDIREDLPVIEADPSQLRQVVLNLIANASEALTRRGDRITITTGTMEADRSYLAETYPDHDLPEGSYVYVQVHDTGIGIDNAVGARVFDPFFTTKGAGRGLGLATVLGIVRAHGGALRVESRPGEGTTVRVLFPCKSTRMDANDGRVLGRREEDAPASVSTIDGEEIAPFLTHYPEDEDDDGLAGPFPLH